MVWLLAAFIIGSTPCGQLYTDAQGQRHWDGCPAIEALVAGHPTAVPTVVPTPPPATCKGRLLPPEHDGFDAYGALYRQGIASGATASFCFAVPVGTTKLRVTFGTDGAQCGQFTMTSAAPSGLPSRGAAGSQGSATYFQPVEAGIWSASITNTGCDSAFRIYAW
jgi:hypothetical protein